MEDKKGAFTGVHERIRARLDVMNWVSDAQIAAEKTDFLVRTLIEDHTSETPTEENQWAWVYSRERIIMMVAVIQDHIADTCNQLADLARKLEEADEEDRKILERGGVKDGRS